MYRPRRFARVAYWILAAASAGITATILALVIGQPGTGWSAGDVTWAVIGAIGSGIWTWFMLRSARLQVAIDTSGLLVVNYLSSKRIPWGLIDRFEVGHGYWGIEAVMAEGHAVTLNAIQKSNAATWLGKRTRADAIVEELNGLLQGQR